VPPVTDQSDAETAFAVFLNKKGGAPFSLRQFLSAGKAPQADLDALHNIPSE
jgi:hypothetical protein